MKLIKKIYKELGSRRGECIDESAVNLVSPRSDDDIRYAVGHAGWHPHNARKVIGSNRLYPLGHPKGGYFADQSCTVIFG